MALFRWALLLAGICVIAGIFAYGRGWLTFRLPRFRRAARAPEALPDEEVRSQDDNPEQTAKVPTVKPPPLTDNSKVVAVRIMPQQGQTFPAEQLVLIMRGTGLQHGKYGIFHRIASDDSGHIRYSVASLVEPGSFDLARLKESSYKGVSIFMILPAPEDGVALFDEMLDTARTIARGVNGRLVDEDGTNLSVQRERYMREEVIEFQRRRNAMSSDNA